MNRNLVYQTTKDEIRLTIYLDESAESPRDWDNLGTMVCAHRRYTLGDEQIKRVGKYGGWKGWLEKEVLTPNTEEIVYLPLYLYDHSGLVMNTTGYSCPRDSGQVGWIYAKKGKYNEEETRYLLEKEVEVYNAYLQGQVFGYVIEREEICYCCKQTQWIHLDSCWGFYGEDAKEEMQLQAPEEYVDLFVSWRE